LKGNFYLQNDVLSRKHKDKLNYIYTGMQIIKPEVFTNLPEDFFSINRIWDDLIKKDELSGIESNIDFFHISTLDIYNKLSKNYFKD
jgi:hypothetical protein